MVNFKLNKKFIKKSISPLIATILLIVVSVAIIGIVVSWSKGFTNISLNKNKFEVNNDFKGFIFTENTINPDFIILKNYHSFKKLNIKGYYIISNSKYSFLNNHFFDLNLIAVPSYQENILKLACTPENSFLINLVLDDNSYVYLKYNNNRSDNSSCIKDISIGIGHICSLLATGEVKCWGRNIDGQLGDGTYINKNYPVYVCDNNIFDCQNNKQYRLKNIVQISSGFHHTCALNKDNEVFCWGANSYGELGVGNFSKSNFPLKVSNLNNFVKQINSGWGFNCALLYDNTAKCWGRNAWGCVGNGQTTNVSIPTNVLFSDNNIFLGIKEIKSTGQTSYLKTIDNKVYFWGANNFGQFGDENYSLSTYSDYPKLMNHSFEKYFLNYHHVCALNSEGDYYCFGKNNYGQLGDGTVVNKNYPVKTNIKFVNISVGGHHTCGISYQNKIYCWGLNNSYGALGDNTIINSSVPVQTIFNETPLRIFTGYQNSCVITNQGDIFCWGSNVDGTLGNETNNNTLIPVKISNSIYN